MLKKAHDLHICHSPERKYMPTISTLRLTCQEPQPSSFIKLFISTLPHLKAKFEADSQPVYCSDTDHGTVKINLCS